MRGQSGSQRGRVATGGPCARAIRLRSPRSALRLGPGPRRRPPLLWNLSLCCTRVRLAWADAGYAGKLATWAAILKIQLEIVRRRDAHAFEVLPRRWVVERTFAWISKHRRTTRDYERLPASHEAMILWAMIALMTRRLAQPAHLSNTH